MIWEILKEFSVKDLSGIRKLLTVIGAVFIVISLAGFVYLFIKFLSDQEPADLDLFDTSIFLLIGIGSLLLAEKIKKKLKERDQFEDKKSP